MLDEKTDMQLFEVEQDVMDLEEEVHERTIPKQEMSEKLMTIADKLRDLQNDGQSDQSELKSSLRRNRNQPM